MLKIDNFWEDFDPSDIPADAVKEETPLFQKGENTYTKEELLSDGFVLHDIDLEEDFEEFSISNICDYDTDTDYFRINTIDYEDKDVKIFTDKRNEFFLIELGGKKHLFQVYEINSIYRKKNVITLTGWDYNMIIDLDDKTIETEYTR